MIRITGKIKSIKELLAIVLFNILVCGVFSLISSRLYNRSLSLSILIFGISIMITIIFCGYYVNKAEMNSNIYNISISINNNNLDAKGFYDSGNVLIDTYTNNPVIILQCSEIIKLLGKGLQEIILQYQKNGDFDYEEANKLTEINFYPISYRTINKNLNIMPAFKLSCICFSDEKSEYNNITAGISRYNFTTDNSYTVLLNQKIKPFREENSND